MAEEWYWNTNSIQAQIQVLKSMEAQFIKELFLSNLAYLNPVAGVPDREDIENIGNAQTVITVSLNSMAL